MTAVLIPSGALQLAVSREVSRHRALDENEEADAFGRAMLRLGLLVTAPLVAVAAALTLPLSHVLDIQATAAAAVVLGSLVTALAGPVLLGILLGHQRFYAVAGLYVLPFAVRLGILAVAAAAGYRLGGAVTATAASAIVTTGFALWLVRASLAGAARAARPSVTPFLRYLWPVFVGLLGIAVLTTTDLLIVRARFDPSDSGEYAAASAFARVAFFLPATILVVLFPRTAARQARGEETEDILGRSLIVTAAFGAFLALAYGMTGRGLVHTSFGAEFAQGGELLVLLTISMTLYALVNVLVGFHLSRDETRYAWIVAAAVPVQLAVLALVPETVEGVILANLVVATGLLMAHELFVDTSVFAIGSGFRHFARPIARSDVRGLATEGLLVLAGGALFVALMFWPLVAGLGSTVVGEGSDASGMMAQLWWMTHEGGYHVFGDTHHVLTGAPFGWDDANGLKLQLLLPYYPAYLATKLVGPIAAYNFVLLAGYVLSGASMYLLTRYLGCARLVAAWAGVVYIVFPWHLARTPHGSLVHLEFLPLLILVLVAAARTPTWTRFSLVGVTTLACWLTSGYFGVMAVVTAGAFALAAALAQPLRRGAVLLAGCVGAAIGASLVVAVLSIISGFGRGAGLDRSPGDLEVYGVRPLELLVPSPGNLLVGDWSEGIFGSRQHGSNPTETRNYLGWLTLLLAVSWLIVAWRKRRQLTERVRLATLGISGVAVAALLLAAPSPVTLFGRQVWMPSRVLWEIVPAVRVPSRWVALLMTALVPLAALGLEAGWRWVSSRGAGRRTAYALVTAVMVASFLELTVHAARPRFETSPAPPIYQALERLPAGIVAEYPLLTSNDHIIWQTVYRRPLFGNADFGTRADDARRVFLNPRVPGVAESLALLGVTAIITYPDALDYNNSGKTMRAASWGPGYQLVTRSADGTSLWRVVATPAPVLVTLPGGFGESIVRGDDFVGYPLISPSGVGTVEFTARNPAIVRLHFDATPPRSGQILRLADADTEIGYELNGTTSISVVVEVPRGHSYLTVKTDPAATSADDAVVLSRPRATRAAGEPALVAELISPDPGY